MALEKIFDEKNNSKYYACKWAVFAYVGKNGKCKAYEFLKTKATTSGRRKIIEKLEELAFKGPDELMPPSFDEAGDIKEDFIMYRIRKGQDRLYMALQRSKKRIILTSGNKKKTNKTADTDKMAFRNIVGKIIQEEEV